MKIKSLHERGLEQQPLRVDLWGVLTKPVGGFPLHIIIIGVFCTAFGLTGVFIDISHGYYGLKISFMVLFTLLLFRRRYYSFLMGLLVPCYFVLKAPGMLPYDKTLMLSYSHLMVILMAFFLVVGRPISKGKQNGLITDFPAIMSMLLITVVIAGVTVAENGYLFTRRLVEILGFVSAYIVGGRFNSNLQVEARLLLLGLAFSAIAFTVPFTIGFVVRHGLGVLGELDAMLNEIGAQSSAIEAGITLLIFAYSYTLFIVSHDRKIKRTALWFSFLAALLCFLFISKGAIFSMLLVVLYTLVATLTLDSVRKRLIRTWAVIIAVGALFMTMVIGYLPGLVDSFLIRASRANVTAEGRFYIWKKAIEVGMEHFTVGVGAGQFRIYTQIWHAHNDFLTMLAEHGFIGALAYLLIMIYLCLVCIWMFRLKREFRLLAILYGSVLIAYLVYSQVEPLFTNRAGLLFMFLSGWVVTGYRSRRLYVPYTAPAKAMS